MTTPAFRAGVLCAGLVGGLAALTSIAAHGADGGTFVGGAVAVLLVACATVGATAGAVFMRVGTVRSPTLIVGLLGGQALSHLVLTGASAHHAGEGLPSASMLAAHIGAAVALGLLISLVGHFYEVCVSVLAWLSLMEIHRSRPSALPWSMIPGVVHSRLTRSGLRMRAPPLAALSGG